jgi:hypothetical protein
MFRCLKREERKVEERRREERKYEERREETGREEIGREKPPTSYIIHLTSYLKPILLH